MFDFLSIVAFAFGLAAQKIDGVAAPRFLAIRLANHSAGNTT